MRLSRFDDNFDALRADTNKSYTLLPQIKGLNLSTNGQYKISFGGEVRQQLQVFNNESWGALSLGQVESNSGKPFLLQRYLFHTNIKLSRYFRIFGELKSALENGRASGPRPVIDEDRLALQQAFADINFFPSDSATLTLRIGRQELNYGANRLISSGEGLNTKQVFQGIKVLTSFRGIKTDVFYTHQVSNRPGFFDNIVNKPIKLYGVYSAFKSPLLPGDKMELYIIGYQNANTRYVRNGGLENRYAIGFRASGFLTEVINYQTEVTYQAGKVESAPIAAYMAMCRIIYRLSEKGAKPAIGLVAQLATGDRAGSNSLNTYNPLYARDYYGLGVPYWSSNLMQLTPTFEIKPTPKLTIEGAAHGLWRQSTGDGLYLAGNLMRSPFISGSNTLSNKKFTGIQYDLNPIYAITRYFTLNADLTYLAPTNYVRQTGTANNLFFCNLQASFKF